MRTLFLCVFIAAAVSADAASASLVSLNVLTDTWVTSGAVNSSAGGADTNLRAGVDDSVFGFAPTYRILLAFDLSTVPPQLPGASVTSAQLVLTTNGNGEDTPDSTDLTLDLHVGNTASNNASTWSNSSAGNPGTLLSSSANVPQDTTGDSISFGPTGNFLSEANTVFGAGGILYLVVKDSVEGVNRFTSVFSSEGPGTAPQLNLTFNPEPTSAMLFVSAILPTCFVRRRRRKNA